MRGTTRTPGADPTRLPIGLDLRAISIAEGVRAGLAAALPVAAAVWLDQPLLSLAALGALLTCICDPGGPLRRRLPLLLTFVTDRRRPARRLRPPARPRHPPNPRAGPANPLRHQLARVYGAPAAGARQPAGRGPAPRHRRPAPAHQALKIAATFAAGGAWALLLTLALWRIHPYGPARRAVADVWDALATSPATSAASWSSNKPAAPTPRTGKPRPAPAAAPCAPRSNAPASS